MGPRLGPHDDRSGLLNGHCYPSPAGPDLTRIGSPAFGCSDARRGEPLFRRPIQQPGPAARGNDWHPTLIWINATAASSPAGLGRWLPVEGDVIGMPCWWDRRLPTPRLSRAPGERTLTADVETGTGSRGAAADTTT